MAYVDTHCHIDKYDNPLAVIRAAEAANVVTVAVTELPSAYQRLSLRVGARKHVRVALGLHPLRIADVTPLERALFTRMVDGCDYIGEVGLDGSPHGKVTLRDQTKLFEDILQQPRAHQKVFTVHSRGAEQGTIERLSQAGITAILHWYSGPLKHVDAALAAGLWFSVNAAMLASKNGKRIIESIPPERVVTETDGPYTKARGRQAEPRDIPAVVAGLARLWSEEPEHARKRVYDNMADIAAAARQA